MAFIMVELSRTDDIMHKFNEGASTRINRFSSCHHCSREVTHNRKIES
jgi:hypothetical protein